MAFLTGVAAHRQFAAINTGIKFKKTGEEIRKSIIGAVADLEAQIAKKVAKIEKICLARDITLQEVLDGAEDHEVAAAYNSKAYAAAPKTNAVIQALQEDLSTLATESQQVVEGKRQIEGLSRVSNNIEAGAVFELSYHELLQFGF